MFGANKMFRVSEDRMLEDIRMDFIRLDDDQIVALAGMINTSPVHERKAFLERFDWLTEALEWAGNYNPPTWLMSRG